ncbi:chlorophyll A-B binding protein [Nitzschia inconspicua]|uniref:Chlorophyll A-B binding protein n=1 Tax=Nitzschia inconspicua TaxID=303405 RepID=A0A9K3K7U1_9STRA|nr:chlorophyll A-B binding protein [Nitzschia inconspicua]KAG7359365.1 chlorophyll A-B binding protein [Nitzschia inconspicua]KAG7365690.1 chlorophyll A-B binding protein [Nitzschia inconspicua]
MKTFSISLTLATLACAASSTLAFVPAATSPRASFLRLSMSTTMPPRSELKGYYTSLTERNEQLDKTTDRKMVASEMGAVYVTLGLADNLDGFVLYERIRNQTLSFGHVGRSCEDVDYFPGNLNFDPLGLYPKDKKGQLEMQAKEIRNGRLARLPSLDLLHKSSSKAMVSSTIPPSFSNLLFVKQQED